MKKVLLALSGGVDSAFAAYLLKKKKYEIHACFMKNFSGIKDKITGECNWVSELQSARKIAALLEIPLEVIDFEKEYRDEIIKPLFDDYKRGITPNPDTACNTLIKFPLLWREAKKRKCDYIATGHYAQIKKTREGFELHRAKDETKDQSYFLYGLSQNDLEHTLFPVGSYTKKEIRSETKKKKFPNWNKKSTRGLCFVGNIPLKQFLAQKLKQKKGDVVDTEGKVIGSHMGAHYYTFGERARPSIGIELEKGMLAQKRFFVAGKDMKKNILQIVPEGHPLLLKDKIVLKETHWIGEPSKSKDLCVRVRHLGNLEPARLEKRGKTWICLFKNPQKGIAPGQIAAIYEKTRLLGGGIIAR
jgi:tRNA-specific 2-thiouridylase